MWLVRNKSGKLLLFFQYKPKKNDKNRVWFSEGGSNDFAILPKEKYPSVTWEDQEPTEVEVCLKLTGPELEKESEKYNLSSEFSSNPLHGLISEAEKKAYVNGCLNTIFSLTKKNVNND